MGIEEVLIRILNSKNMKQAELSRITGIPTSLISNYIKGSKSPTLTNSIKLAEALNITIDELAGMHSHNSIDIEKVLTDISKEALNVASAYDDADLHGKNVVRMALRLPLIQEEPLSKEEMA